MTKREVISQAPSPSLPFSKAIGYGDLVFVSGLVGRDPETGEIAQDVQGQTEQVMENIRRELELAGTSLDNVLKATVFIFAHFFSARIICNKSNKLTKFCFLNRNFLTTTSEWVAVNVH